MENPLLTAKPQVELLYKALLSCLESLGELQEEVKKASVHLVAGKGAFLGVHPRSDGIMLTIVLNHALQTERLHKAEKVSSNRFHNEIKVTRESDLDAELIGWVSEAYVAKLHG